MKLDDVVEVNLVDLSPKETQRPVRKMVAKIITEDVEIRIYNGAQFRPSGSALGRCDTVVKDFLTAVTSNSDSYVNGLSFNGTTA